MIKKGTVSLLWAGGPMVLGGGYGWRHGPGMMGWGYGMALFRLVTMAVFWVALVLLIIFVIRRLIVSGRSQGGHSTAGDSALEILKKRYARGEINREEFEETKKDLS